MNKPVCLPCAVESRRWVAGLFLISFGAEISQVTLCHIFSCAGAGAVDDFCLDTDLNNMLTWLSLLYFFS